MSLRQWGLVSLGFASSLLLANPAAAANVQVERSEHLWSQGAL